MKKSELRQIIREEISKTLAEGNAKQMRQPVAKELSQLQRLGKLSVKTDAVERTLKGEFDKILSDSMSVRDAVDSIVDIVGRRR